MTKNPTPSIEEYLPLMLSAAGALGVLPFAILRFANGDYLIGFLDTTIVTGLLGLAYYLYITHRTRVASVGMTLLCVAGVLSTIYLRGPGQVYWVFPSLVAVFFLVKRREAVVMSMLVVIALVPALSGKVTSIALTSILVTVVVTCAFAYAFATMTRNQRDTLMKLATKDPLTGAGNRRALETKLDDIIAARSRTNIPSSLLMLDLDHFKQINDNHGHATGDQILTRVTEIINMRIRVTDSVYRIGGEEFVVVVEGESIDNASRLAEQLRTIIEANDLAPGGSVTISLGVAEHEPGESARHWCRRADDALYEAKNSGRNTIMLAA